MEKKQILDSLIDFLIKEGDNQSMDEDFYYGYEQAIYEIKKFNGDIEDRRWLKPWHKSKL